MKALREKVICKRFSTLKKNLGKKIIIVLLAYA